MPIRITTTGPSATAERADPQRISERLRRQLSATAFEGVQKIRKAEEPDRRVGGGARNFVVDITSHLMRRTMRVESNLEAAWAKVISEDQHTLEIYEQAKFVEFRYTTASGAVMVVREVLDFFVISEHDDDPNEPLIQTFASVMREEELVGLAQAMPWRYVRASDGWRDEALTWYLQRRFGAGHEIWTDTVAIDIVLRNIEYTQSFRTLPRLVASEIRDAIVAAVSQFPGDTAEELLRRVPTCSADDFLQMLVNGDGVFCDELREFIGHHWTLHLYPAPILVRTVGQLPQPAPIESSVLDLTEGGQFRMGESVWTVVAAGGEQLTCKDPQGRLHSLERRSIEEEFEKHGAVRAVPRTPGSAAQEVGRLDGKAKDRLIQLAQLQLRIQGGERPVLRRGQQEALAAFRALERAGQDGRFALVAGWGRSGRWGSRISEDERRLVVDVLGRERLRAGAHGFRAAYAVYVKEFGDDATFTAEQRLAAARARSPRANVGRPMARVSFKKLGESLHDEIEAAQAQQGHKAANALQIRRPVGGGSGVVGRGITSKGLYPWDKAYADTNEIDAYTKDGVTGEVLRLRTTAMRDGATDLVLAEVTEPHEPNEETFLELLRECVYRHGYLPRRLALDNAKVHGGILVTSACATMMMEREFGPKGHGRFRSEIENVFHTLNARADLVEGTSKPAKNVRALSPSHRPDLRAIWPTGRFEDEVVKKVFYELINQRRDPKDGLSAQERYDRRKIEDGMRENDRIAFDAIFLINTAPPVRTKGPHAGKLLVRGQGVRGERGEHFTCDALTRAHVVNTYVEAKREPWDISKRYVKVDGEWHVAISEALAEHLVGRSPREIKKLSAEMRARIGHEPDARELGEYIASLRTSESELRKNEKRTRLMAPLRAAAQPATVTAGAPQDALEALDSDAIKRLASAPSAEDAA